MKKSKLRLAFALLAVVGLQLLPILAPKQVYAADPCGNKGIHLISSNPDINTVEYLVEGETVTLKIGGFPPGMSNIELWNNIPMDVDTKISTATSDGNGEATFTFVVAALWNQELKLELRNLTGSPNKCSIGKTIPIVAAGIMWCNGADIKIAYERGGQQCFWVAQNGCLEVNETISVTVSNVKQDRELYSGILQIKVDNAQVVGGSANEQDVEVVNGSTTGPAKFIINKADRGKVSIEKPGPSQVDICNREVSSRDSCPAAECVTEDPGEGGDLEPATEDPYFLCDQLPKGSQAKQNCIRCATGGRGEEKPGDDESRRGIWTAIGCIKREPQNIIASLIQVGLMMGGGIALLMILAAGFLISTSQGDPKKVSDAKELITAAVTGLLFIIFSVMMLQFIGFSVFKLPGFGG